jgi:hypothetical protein
MPDASLTDQGDDISWAVFWSIMKAAGVSEADVHKILKVKSVSEWTATRREAVIVILSAAVTSSRALAKAKMAQASAPAAVVTKSPKDIVKADIPNVDILAQLANEYWQLTEDNMWGELGYTNRQNFKEAQVQTIFEVWQVLLEKHG